jgi:hypothetical protein
MATYTPTDLVDPCQLKMSYMNTPVMARSYIGNLQEGHYVRVRRNQEAFWLILDKLIGEVIHGKVFYKLKFNDYKIQDILIFNRKFVFDVYTGDLWNKIPVQPA